MLASIHQDYILNSTTKGICICDWNGRVLVMNDVFYEMFKISEKKSKGLSCIFPRTYQAHLDLKYIECFGRYKWQK